MKYLKRILSLSAVLPLALILLAGCQSPVSNSSVEPGFESLFDGETLEGWKLLGKKGDGYVVQDGAIVCQQGGGGNLLTEREFEDFVLRLEFKLKPGSNNGLGIRAPMTATQIAYYGMELQVIDNTAEKYAKLKPYQYHGSIYGVHPAERGALRPVGEWNVQEVTAIGRRIKVKLNGKVIVDVDLNTITDKDILLAHPGMLRDRGHIGFLGHNDWVAFRNIRVKEIPRARVDNAAPEGFKALFNGRNLDGWQGVVENPPKRAAMSIQDWARAQVAANDVARTNWIVLDGALTHIGKKFYSLSTDWDYGNFELLADWKTYPGGDSGIYVRGCPQIQIWTETVGSGGLFNNKTNPSVPLVRADRFPGTWNKFRILMIDDKVSVQLNGETVVHDLKKRTGVTLENYWERDKPVYPFGPIELQAHESAVHFKNIFIRELP